MTVGRLAIWTREAVEVVDLTARIEAFVLAAALEAGWVNVQSRHTTAGIVVNENEPGLLRDALALLERLAPRVRATITTSCTCAPTPPRTSVPTGTPTRRRSSCAPPRP